MAEEIGEKIWPGWSEAPFAILLLTKEREFLVYHPNPTSDFVALGYDSVLVSKVFARDRIHDLHLLATFPAVAGVPTIVIGQPKNTEASHSTRWVITLLHEHFHQWQMSQPDYYRDVNALGLSSGDSTGMWMLNYPFPYEDDKVGSVFAEMCDRLHAALTGVGTSGHDRRVDAYLAARAKFADAVTAEQYAYFSFQVWQEGVARYTEYAVAARSQGTYRSSAAFAGLPDVVPFSDDARATRDQILADLSGMSLKKSGRVAFYSAGAGEALLLDKESPRWREQYLQARFDIGRFHEKGARR